VLAQQAAVVAQAVSPARVIVQDINFLVQNFNFSAN
jgi:hypothetical protein